MKDIKKMVSDLENRKKALDTRKIESKNSISNNKDKLMQRLFNMMKKNGVDLSDMNSINSFLISLEERDPDLKALFENAFNQLTGDEPSPMGSNSPIVSNPLGGSSPTGSFPQNPIR